MGTITGLSAAKVHNNSREIELNGILGLLSTDVILILDYKILFSDSFDLKNEE